MGGDRGKGGAATAMGWGHDLNWGCEGVRLEGWGCECDGVGPEEVREGCDCIRVVPIV